MINIQINVNNDEEYRDFIKNVNNDSSVDWNFPPSDRESFNGTLATINNDTTQYKVYALDGRVTVYKYVRENENATFESTGYGQVDMSFIEEPANLESLAARLCRIML